MTLVSAPAPASSMRFLEGEAPAAVVAGRIALGAPDLDDLLGGGLARAAVHEAFAASDADAPAAIGFAVALLTRAAPDKPVVWVRQDALDAETGRPYPLGLAEFGFDPARLILVRARTMEDVLRAAGEAARCAALGGVLIEPWGAHKRLDLTASRRLALRAEAARIPIFLVRTHACPEPSAAATRWRIRARPSRALPADAPGAPTFEATLLRHRGGGVGGPWLLEWNRDDRRFTAVAAPAVVQPTLRNVRRRADAAPLGAVVSVSAHRSRTAHLKRRTG